MDGSSYHLSPSGSPHSNTNSGAIPRRNTTDASPKVQDRFLPIANVGRIMKKSLPANAKISKEAKETVQECVSEFIGFVTGEASDKCRREKRKTINGEDLLWAMTTLGFEGYAVHLGVFLDKCREADGEKSPMAMQGDHDQSPMEGKARDGSAKQGLLDDVYSIPENMAVNLDIPSTSPEFYSLDTRTMAQGFVGGGMGKGYGQTDSIFGNYTMNLREDNGIGDANGATAWAAHHHHGVQYWF